MTCLLSYFMLLLSLIFLVVCSTKTRNCWQNFVKDFSKKHEKTTSQKVKCEIKWELDLHKSWNLNFYQRNCKCWLSIFINQQQGSLYSLVNMVMVSMNIFAILFYQILSTCGFQSCWGATAEEIEAFASAKNIQV